MSVVKLLSRIVAPSEIELASSGASSLHDHTYGITSDPLIQFSTVFSALIHDVDHSGVPNAQLVKEKAPVAAAYKNLSVAEQNSLEIAFELLLEEEYKDLRAAIYREETELKRFRSLVVNSVMATDIVDKELKGLRNARWEKAFSECPSDATEDEQVAINRKATIVIEHLIQASDVSHTMQHVSIRNMERLCQINCISPCVSHTANTSFFFSTHQHDSGTSIASGMKNSSSSVIAYVKC